MRGFTEEEKIYLRTQLLEKGRSFFSVHGFKKTSIKDLTNAVGIAQGSFYLFFQSKEEIYFRILEEEEEKIKSIITRQLPSAMTAKTFAAFLLSGIQLIQDNPFIRQLFFEGELETLIRKLPKEIVEEHIHKDTDLLAPLLDSWGIKDKQEQDIVSGAIRSFFLLAVHEKAIGNAHYDQTIQFLAEAIADKIFARRMNDD
ncbi:TetR/AcrR family transcriptional regulator [Cytobacillus dafuensis]|uniref:TetR/AcrR family transcriptional regulator n=1 Tax=Cytobacillus dafuensis TaxID=1742359 RepID=A0A5B8ZA42_CYTDA|nr:TetR/AcrR family transcriptional regulator [Cytobacillus dafuensis]QED49801.1 TetR/AcrR family transcriptional regulator [Cytobacillus dafuensis]